MEQVFQNLLQNEEKPAFLCGNARKGKAGFCFFLSLKLKGRKHQRVTLLEIADLPHRQIPFNFQVHKAVDDLQTNLFL